MLGACELIQFLLSKGNNCDNDAENIRRRRKKLASWATRRRGFVSTRNSFYKQNNKGKVKVKVTLEQDTKVQRRSRGIALLFL